MEGEDGGVDLVFGVVEVCGGLGAGPVDSDAIAFSEVGFGAGLQDAGPEEVFDGVGVGGGEGRGEDVGCEGAVFEAVV